MSARDRFGSLKSLPRRTGLITAAAVFAVVTSGAAAVGANVGILNLASGTTTGKLTADELALSTAASGASRSSATAGQPQLFQVSDAGTVSLVVMNNVLTLVEITPNASWTTSVVGSGSRSLEAGFTKGSRVVSFKASVEDNGGIETEIHDSASSSSTSTSSTGPTSTTSSTSPDGASASTSTSLDDDEDHDDDDSASEVEHRSDDHDASSSSDDREEDRDGSSEDNDDDDRVSTSGSTSTTRHSNQDEDHPKGSDDDD